MLKEYWIYCTCKIKTCCVDGILKSPRTPYPSPPSNLARTRHRRSLQRDAPSYRPYSAQSAFQSTTDRSPIDRTEHDVRHSLARTRINSLAVPHDARRESEPKRVVLVHRERLLPLERILERLGQKLLRAVLARGRESDNAVLFIAYSRDRDFAQVLELPLRGQVEHVDP